MSGISDINRFQIRCGHIFVFGHFNFSFHCDLCKNVYGTSEEFTLHIKDHFSQLPNVKDEIDSIGICAMAYDRPEISDDIMQENRTDADVNNYVPQLPTSIKRENSFSMDGSVNDEPVSWVQHSSVAENSIGYLEDDACTQSPAADNHRKNNSSEPKVSEVESPKRLTNRLYTKQLGHEIANTSGEHISSRPDNIDSQQSSAPKKSKGNFECSFCNKFFTRKRDLNNHENSHTGNRPYECQLCPKAFTNESNLNGHVKSVHTKTLSHKCSVCKKRFASNVKLDNHTRQEHLAITDPRRYFLCNECDGKFDTRNKLVYHRLIMHPKSSDTFTCDLCQRVFQRRKNIARHMKIHAGTNNFRCKHCNKKLSQSSGKSRHERKCVFNSN